MNIETQIMNKEELKFALALWKILKKQWATRLCDEWSDVDKFCSDVLPIPRPTEKGHFCLEHDLSAKWIDKQSLRWVFKEEKHWFRISTYRSVGYLYRCPRGKGYLAEYFCGSCGDFSQDSKQVKRNNRICKKCLDTYKHVWDRALIFAVRRMPIISQYEAEYGSKLGLGTFWYNKTDGSLKVVSHAIWDPVNDIGIDKWTDYESWVNEYRSSDSSQ